MSDILDEEVPNRKEKLSTLKSAIKFEEGEEEYGRNGCMKPIGILLFVLFILIVAFF